MKSQIPVAVAMVVGLTIVACGTDRPTQHYSGVNQAAGPVPNPPEAPKPANILHFYDFQGPSMTIDVGCSTGLVALHQACQSLRSGESEISVVGSSLVLLSPDMFIAMSIAGYVGAYMSACYRVADAVIQSLGSLW